MFEEIEKELGWESKIREPKDYKVLDEIKIGCLNCNIQLIHIIKVKESEKTNNIKVICPKCGEESFLTRISGEIYIGGEENIVVVNAYTNKTDGIYNTILEVKMSDRITTNICLDGTIASEDTKNRDILAKCHLNPETSNQSYYIRFESGRMVDPNNRDIRRNTIEQAQWKRVQQNVYNLYLQFLTTHKKSFLYKAEREHNE